MDLGTESAVATWPSELRPANGLQLTLHDRFDGQRTRIVSALWGSFERRHRAAASKMADCCRRAEVFVDPESGRVRQWLMRCKHRACPFCGRGRTAQLADAAGRLIRSMRYPKHITLTYRANLDPLPQQIRDLRRAWARLRRRKLWSSHVAGGIYALEITRNAETGQWHPHLHIVADATFIPHADLVDEWSECMPEGLNVWITAVRQPKRIANELAKYVGKPPSVRDFPDHAICDYVDAVSGRRMIHAFGSLYGKGIFDKPDKPEESPATYSVSVARVAYLAGRGHDVAVDLVGLIARRWPMYRPYLQFAIGVLPALASFERRPLWADLADADAPARSPPAGSVRASPEYLDASIFAAITRFRRLDQDGGFAYDDSLDGARP